MKFGESVRSGPTVFLCGLGTVVLSVVLALVTIGRHILGPLDAAARHRRHPTQFTMADFLALVFLLQLPVALLRLVLPDDASPVAGFLYGFAWIASSLMWGLSVQTLSRAGIATPWRRVVFLSAVLPITYFGSLVFVSAALFGLGEAFFDNSVKQITRFWWCLATGAVLFMGFYWAGSFVRAMVAQSQNNGPVDENPGSVERETLESLD
ncbi:MAG TPA: hypothetical protein VG826_08965 [Pirellulales bacterium]|nr:hypothetical protein [Pirellulales bacterium]